MTTPNIKNAPLAGPTFAGGEQSHVSAHSSQGPQAGLFSGGDCDRMSVLLTRRSNGDNAVLFTLDAEDSSVQFCLRHANEARELAHLIDLATAWMAATDG